MSHEFGLRLNGVKDAENLRFLYLLQIFKQFFGGCALSKGKQIRHELTGETKFVMENLDDPYLTPEGTFDTSVHPDCDLYDPRSISAVAGFKDWRYFLRKLRTGASSIWHAYKIPVTVVRTDGIEEKKTMYATHSDSADAGGKIHREHRAEQQRQRLKRGTDVSSKNTE